MSKSIANRPPLGKIGTKKYICIKSELNTLCLSLYFNTSNNLIKNLKHLYMQMQKIKKPIKPNETNISIYKLCGCVEQNVSAITLQF